MALPLLSPLVCPASGVIPSGALSPNKNKRLAVVARPPRLAAIEIRLSGEYNDLATHSILSCFAGIPRDSIISIEQNGSSDC